MSVHNDRRYLPAAVESILRQSLEDLELLVIDDGSTDGSFELLRKSGDARVRPLRNETNLGLPRSLNRGIELATGHYLARIDADDVAMPQRLARQVEFLDAHKDVGIVGSSRVLIDEEGNVIVPHAPAAEDDLRIRWKCLLGNPFAHPTVMFRRALLDKYRLRYDECYRTAQDYELWSRLLKVTEGHNLPEALLQYRLRQGVSRTHKPEQLRNHDRIALASILRLVPGFEISQTEVTALRGRFGGFSVRDSSMDPDESRWVSLYLRLLDAFAREYRASAGIAALVREVRETCHYSRNAA